MARQFHKSNNSYDRNEGGERFDEVQGILLVRPECGLQTIMEVPIKTIKKYEMKINVKKTKVMRVCRDWSK